MIQVLKIDIIHAKNLYPFILLTEFINIPIVIFNQNVAFAILSLGWFLWTSWVQICGLITISKQPATQVVRGYILYFLLILFIITVLYFFLLGTGMIDANTIKNFQHHLQN